jgi:hypothetical protein
MRATVRSMRTSRLCSTDLRREHNLSLDEAVNRVIRAGLAATGSQPFSSPTRDMGTPTVDLEHALERAGALENAELLRKTSTRE